MSIEPNILRRIFLGLIASAVVAVSPGDCRAESSGSETAAPPAAASGNGENSAAGPVAARNGKELHVDFSTSGFYWMDTKTGEKRYAAVPDADSDKVANDENKSVMKSLFEIEYYDHQGNRYTMNTFDDCLAYENQLTVRKIENGVQSTFILGKQDTRRVIPCVMEKEDFEKYLENVDDTRTKMQIQDAYKLFTPGEVADDADREQLLAMCPALEHEEIYVFREILTNKEISESRQNSIVEESFIEAGFTADDIDTVHTKLEYSLSQKSMPVFEIPLKLTLDDQGDLLAEIVMEQVRLPQNFFLHQISLLPYLGASHQKETGYFLVPDGSGAIIDFYTDRKDKYYIKSLYGSDKTIPEPEKNFLGQNMMLPVYGISTSKSAMFAIAESGDALGSVAATIAGSLSEYYSIHFSFTVSPTMFMEYPGNQQSAGVNLFPADISREAIRLRYQWLEGPGITYVDMAKSYRDYLEKNGTLKRMSGLPGNVPFYMELQGAIQKKSTFLGIGYTRTIPLTKFDEAKNICGEAKNSGIENISVRYRAWAKGGYQNRLNNKVQIEKALGGKKGFLALAGYLKEQNISFYPEAEFLYVGSDHAFDGFSIKRDSSRGLDKKVVADWDYDLAAQTRKQGTSRYVLSPKKLNAVIQSYLKHYKAYGIGGLSAGSMGRDINADFNAKNTIDRNKAKSMISAGLASIRDQGYSIMVDGGNAYTFSYAGVMLDVPLVSSRVTIEDRMVPFYEIVTHGYIEYAGEAINTSQDHVQMLLKSVETGGGLYYRWMYAEDAVLKDTEYACFMYSMNYDTWIADAAKTYKRVNEALKGTQTATIDAHRKVAPGVFETVFSNGTAVIVNYNETSVLIDGKTIGARDFARKGA